MLPTLEPKDFVLAKRVEPSRVVRGDLLVFTPGEDVWIMRVAGLPGDTIQLLDGVVVINGRKVVQQSDGDGPLVGASQFSAGKPSKKFLEQFPGEKAPHAILNVSDEFMDNTPVYQVPSDSFFVLGDNRDNARDSRYRRDPFLGAIGPVQFEYVYGIVERPGR